MLVIHAPDERLLSALLERVDRALFRQTADGAVMRVPAPCRSWGGRCMFTRIGDMSKT